MCAASPARNRRPKRIGSATKLRSGAMLFSIDGPVTRFATARGVEAALELGPEALVRPVLDAFGERALQVVAAARVAAHAAQREAALVRDVDELVRHRRRVGQQAEPAERIYALVRRQRAGRDALPAHAVEAVAAGDEVARELMLGSAVAVAHDRLRCRRNRARSRRPLRRPRRRRSPRARPSGRESPRSARRR